MNENKCINKYIIRISSDLNDLNEYSFLEAWQLCLKQQLTAFIQKLFLHLWDTVPSVSHAETAISAAYVQADSSVSQ